MLGENVTQAAQFATTGNAVGGIIAYSLALAPAMRGRGTHFLIPADRPRTAQATHGATRACRCPVAEQFYRYLQAPAAQATLARYGFAVPE